MNCLCCGKPLPDNALDSGWHKACVKRFFGTREIPQLDISDPALELLAVKSTSKGFTVPGVQKKLSLHLASEGKPRLTLVDYPTGYILKPQVKEFSALPESEMLVMCMAERCGIATVPHALVREGGYACLHYEAGRPRYRTRREGPNAGHGGFLSAGPAADPG